MHRGPAAAGRAWPWEVEERNGGWMVAQPQAWQLPHPGGLLSLIPNLLEMKGCQMSSGPNVALVHQPGERQQLGLRCGFHWASFNGKLLIELSARK